MKYKIKIIYSKFKVNFVFYLDELSNLSIQLKLEAIKLSLKLQYFDVISIQLRLSETQNGV